MGNYYDSFLVYNSHPKDVILEQQQQVLNEDFAFAPTWHNDIEMEDGFGTLSFVEIEARINDIVDSKIGERISDDYRKILFKDLSFEPKLGSRFRFDNNIWIVYSTDNIRSVHSTAYIRRCNNTINTQDEYGNIHREPCVIDTKPTRSGINEYEELSVPQARQIVMYQFNDWTKDLFINSRILFHRQAYKIGTMLDIDRRETMNTDSIYLVKCYLDDDLVNEHDNLELQIADYKVYDYSIEAPNDLAGEVGKTGVLVPTVYLDGEIVSAELSYASTDETIATIDKNTGEYEFLQEGETSFVVSLKNNSVYSSSVSVVVTNDPVDIYENILAPETTYLSIGQEQVYSVHETLNGEVTTTSFAVSCSGMAQKYYSFEQIDDNSFKIKSLLQNQNALLRVQCTNQRDGSVVEIEIELGGLF